MPNVSNIAKHHIRRAFNSTFFNKEFYTKPRPRGLGLVFEDNRKIRDPYFDDVLNLCIHTDVCKQTGLSLVDLMHLDYPTYTQIRDRLTKDKQEKIRQIEKTQQQFEDRAKALGAKL